VSKRPAPACVIRWTGRAGLAIVAGAALALGEWSSASVAAQRPRLTVERLAALPSLIGTVPSGLAWSPDSSRIAFLWNDQAMPFRDVWVVAAGGGQPKRLTDLAAGTRRAPPSAPPQQDDFGALLADASDRLRPGAAELIWAPDGKSVIFACEDRLYRVGLAGGSAAPLDLPPASRSALAFSPNGRFLSWIQDGDLWLWNRETNEISRATHAGAPAIGNIPGSAFSHSDSEFTLPKWSPDSRHVALHWDDRRRMRTLLFPDYLGEQVRITELRRDLPGDNDQIRVVAILSIERGQVRMIDLPDATDRRNGSFAWSPDATRLLIDQNSEDAKDRWIYVLNVAGGAPEEVLHEQRRIAGTTTTASALWTSDWQSDGKGIVYVSDLDGRHRLRELSLADRSNRALTLGEWSVVSTAFDGSQFSMSSRAREIVFISTKKNPYERQVYRIDEKGGPVTQVSSLPGTHQPLVSPDGARIALMRSDDVTPTELYIVDSRGGPERRITESPPKEFSSYQWVQPRYVTFKSRADGVTLHARLIEPPHLDRSRKYAAIIGPVYSNTVRNQWKGTHATLQQYLALEGQYIGLQVDIRGSVGYGREFRDRAVGDFAGITIDDLQSGAEYLKSLPYVDPSRIGLWGWSYGGLLATMSAFQRPGLYNAVVAGAPATNVWHATTGEVDLAGRPSVNADVFRRSSPVTYAKQLQDHLLIIHGMRDDIVLFKDSVLLAEKLMLLGKDFDFVLLPSSVHDAMRKDYIATFALRKLVEHFDRYLGRGPTGDRTTQRP
jgi:dipeptidyl-peptidase-4